MSREELFNQEAKKAIRRITLQYKPEKIIIFGSFARGKIKASSDIDFFIVKKTTKTRMKRQCEVSRILLDREVPMDIVVYTPAELKKREAMGDPFILEIIKNGKLVYAK